MINIKSYIRNAMLILFVASSIHWLGWSMLRPMLSVYFAELGLPTPMIGLMFFIYALVPLLLAMPAGKLIDIIGTRRSAFIGLILGVIAAFFYTLSVILNLIWPVIIAQLLIGTNILMVWGALAAAIAQFANKETRGNRILANFTFFNSLAQLCGPIVGGLLADINVIFVFSVYISLCLLNFLLVFLIPNKKAENKGEANRSDFNFIKSYAAGFKMMKSNKPFAMALIINVMLFIILDLRMTFFPLYLNDQGFANRHIGMIISLGGLSALIIRPFVGALLDRGGYSNLASMSIILGACCLLGLIFHPPLWILIVIVLVWGLCTGINQPLSLIMVAKSVPSEEQGMGMNLRSMSNRSAELTNPVVFGFVSSFAGISAGFGIMGMVLIVTMLYMYKLIKQYPEHSSDRKIEMSTKS